MTTSLHPHARVSIHARRVRDEAVAPARRAYAEAVATARRAYDEAVATAWFAAWQISWWPLPCSAHDAARG